jgi:ADP-ribose pyrophosphatase
MWKRISTKVLFELPRLTVWEDSAQLPDGQIIQYLRYGYPGKGVVIICTNDENKILLLKEYSYVIDQQIYQLPMGLSPQEEKPEISANRELQEESGFAASSMRLIGTYFQNHRRSNTQAFVYQATGLYEAHLEKDHEEEITTQWFTEEEIDTLIVEGKIVDADSLTSWLYYKLSKNTNKSMGS